MKTLKNLTRTLAPVLAGVAAAIGFTMLPAYAGTGFTANDTNGALVTQHVVYDGEQLCHNGVPHTVVDEITRSTGFGGSYYQFHLAPGLDVTGIVNLVPCG